MVNQDQKHPIFAGLIALVAVAVSIGLILGLVVLVGTHLLGIGGGDDNASSDHGATLYIPSPSATETSTGPGAAQSSEPTRTEPSSPKTSKEPAATITLGASATRVNAMQTFTLSGAYPNGEGSLMRLQRQVGGSWQDFGIPDVAVTGGQYSTTVQTGRPGVQKFRMKDMDHHRLSNVVKVTVG